MSASVKRKGFMKGFNNGASRESRRLDRIDKEFKRQAKRNVKIKKRLVQSSLWDCGVYEVEPKDPFQNVTVGLSDEEEEEDEEEEVHSSNNIREHENDVEELVEMVEEMIV